MPDTSLFKRLWNGLVVPRFGTPIIDGLEKSLSLAGITIPVTDLSEAALVLDQAETQGITISPTNPAHFNVGGAEPVKYTCTGKDDGKWHLLPFNESESYSAKWVPDWTGQKDVVPGTNPGFTLLEFALPSRPYDRRVRATAAAWGYRKSGWASLRLFGLGKISATDFSTSDGSGVVTITSGTVPAGHSATIAARAYGAGTVRLASAEAETWMTVEADPTRMKL